MIIVHREYSGVEETDRFDKSRLCHKQRAMARPKGTAVMVELLKTAMAAGHRAKHVLMDRWFSNPRQIFDVRSLGMNVIAMVRRSSKNGTAWKGSR